MLQRISFFSYFLWILMCDLSNSLEHRWLYIHTVEPNLKLHACMHLQYIYICSQMKGKLRFFFTSCVDQQKNNTHKITGIKNWGPENPIKRTLDFQMIDQTVHVCASHCHHYKTLAFCWTKEGLIPRVLDAETEAAIMQLLCLGDENVLHRICRQQLDIVSQT